MVVNRERQFLLLFLLGLVGCRRAGEPAITVRETHHRAMPAHEASIPAPRGLAIGPNGELVVLDTAARILIFARDGGLLRQWRMPESEVGTPEDLTVLRNGRIVVPDTHYHRVLVFEPDGAVARNFGSYGTGPGQFIYPVSAAEDPEGNLYICEYGSNDRVQKFSGDARFLLSFGSFGTGPDQLQRPSGLAWGAGELYVSDAVNNRIQVFADDGRFLRTLGSPERPLDLRLPYDIALAPSGTLCVVEWGAGRISTITPDGALLGRHGAPGSAVGQFATPWGVIWASETRLFVADTGNRRIVELRL